MKPPKKIENGFLLSALKSANSVLLCTHIYPDGDAVGSLLAAGKILRRLGKHTTLACADAIPQKYRFLPGAEEIVRGHGHKPRGISERLNMITAISGRSGYSVDGRR